MSDKDLDKLFKDKLDKMEVVPPASSWGRIEGKMRPRSFDRKFYWGIAASVAVIFTLGLMIGKNLDGEPQQQNLAQNETQINSQQEDQTIQESTEYQATTSNEHQENNSEKNIQSEKPPVRQQLVAHNSPDGRNVNEDHAKVDVKVDEEMNTEEENYSILTETRKIDLVAYGSLNETEELELNTVKTENVKNIEEPKGLNVNKLLQLAKGLKTDNNSWAILRDAKNELFSLNKKEEGSMD